MRLALLSLGILACAKAPIASPTPQRAALYNVLSVTGLGSDSAESQFTLKTIPGQPGLWSVSTVRTRGAWTRDGVTQRFDSDNVLMGDPWHFLIQHEVAATPATVWIDASGRPERLVDEATWRNEARGRILDLKLPAESLQVGENLLDAQGLVADLTRYFPGKPSTDGPWRRTDRLSGLPVIRDEVCVQTSTGKVLSWRCEGPFEPAEDARAKVHDGTSWTEIAIDRHGLLRLEEGYSGTVVVPTEAGFVDHPIAGQRLVVRQ